MLKGPYRKGASELADQISEAFHSPSIQLIPFTEETAGRNARLRGTHRVSPADAIHLASAASAGVDLFLTNDHSLQPLIIPGIQFIAGLGVTIF